MKVIILRTRRQPDGREEWDCPNPMGQTYLLDRFRGEVVKQFGRRWIVQGARQHASGDYLPAAGEVTFLVKAIED